MGDRAFELYDVITISSLNSATGVMGTPLEKVGLSLKDTNITLQHCR